MKNKSALNFVALIWAAAGVFFAQAYGSTGRSVSGLAWALALVFFGAPAILLIGAGVALLLLTVFFANGASGAQAVSDATFTFGISTLACGLLRPSTQFFLSLVRTHDVGAAFASAREQLAERLGAISLRNSHSGAIALMLVSVCAVVAAQANGYFLLVAWVAGGYGLSQFGVTWRVFLKGAVGAFALSGVFDATGSLNLSADIAVLAFALFATGVFGGLSELRHENQKVSAND